MIGFGEGDGVAHPAPARDDWGTLTHDDEQLLVGRALDPPRSDSGETLPSSSLTALSGREELSAAVPPPAEPPPEDVDVLSWRVVSDVLDTNNERFKSLSDVLAAARPNPPVEDWDDEDMVL